MSKREVKVLYWFEKPSMTHFNIYVGYCIEMAKSGYNTCLLSYYNPKIYFARKKQMKEYKKEYKQKGLNIAFRISKGKLRVLQVSLLLLFNKFYYKKIVLIVRKINYSYLNLIKRLFPKILLVYENEGDFVSEYNYLKKYDKNIDQNILKEYKENIYTSQKIYRVCDFIVTGTEHMGKLLELRYPYLKGKTISVIPTFSYKKFYFDSKIRMKMRKELGLYDKKIYIYIGNVNYGWQNFGTNISLFKEILKVDEKSFFIALIPQSNHKTAENFFSEANIGGGKYIIRSVENYELAKYLMASDMAFVVRDIHTMNYTAPTAKTGEFLATGLPLITTSAIALYNPFIKKYNYGVICYNKQELFKRINEIVDFNIDDRTRKRISIEAAKEFSFESNAVNYINIIKKAINGKN